MNRHNNPKVPFGAETGPPPMIHDSNFIQSNNEWISRSGVANGTRVADSRQSQNSEGIQSVDSSMENPDGYYQGPNALLNLDISASNFMKAMNFEAMTGSDENEDERGDFEPNCDTFGEQYNEQPSLEQHSMDMSIEIENDLAEQQQAIEQAKLLHRFKQFREWQQQQQDLLMAQQQQQLLQLRGEQERVQRMIAQQRQMQWGGVNQKHHNKGNDMRSPPKVKNATTKRASPRHSDPKLHSTIPHTSVQGVALAKETTQEKTDQEIQPASFTSTRIHMVNGRPAPVLPERPVTPDEYKERGNPNLDSDSNTVLSYDAMINDDDEEGIYFIPDNLPETSMPQQPPKMASQGNLLVNGQGFPSMNSRLQEGRPNVSSQPLQPNGGLFEQAQQMQLQLLSQLAAQNGLTFPNHIMPNNTMQNGGFNLPMLNSGHQSRGLHPGFLQNLLFKGTTGNGSHDAKGFGQSSTQHLPNTHGLEVQDEYILQRSKFNSAKNRSPPTQKHTRLKRAPEYEYQSDKNDVSTFNQKSIEKQISTNPGDCTGALSAPEDEEDDWEEVEDIEDDQNDEDYEEEEDEDCADKTQVAVDDDERPIEGIGTKKKTFEELLEEELRKEEERMKGGHSKDLTSQHSTENSGKRPFLKRGEGIARFNVPSSARSKNRKSSVKGQRQTHSAPVSDRSDTRVKTTPTTPTKSRAEKNSSAPRKIINGNKPVERQKKGMGNMNNMKNKPVPPAEPEKMKTRPQLNKHKQASPKQVSSSPPTHIGDTDSVGEISFQKRIKSKAKEEECEADELEEFEILEELADDDVSFISNVSTVNKVVTHLKEAKNGVANDQLVKQQIHKPKQMSHQQQEMKMLYHLQQRKQKQEELAALNAKLKSLSRPVGNFVYDAGDRLESIEESAAVLDYRLREDDSSDKAQTTEKEPKAIPQRKVVSLATRHPTSDQDPGRKPGVQEKGLSCLQQVIDFSDSESDVSDNHDNNETDKSEDSDQSDKEEENESFVVKNIQVHAKNHDTSDRNNNENFAAQNNIISFENNNRNNRTSLMTGSNSSRSSNVLEANSQSNSDRGPTPVSNNLSSSGGSSTLKFDAQNKNAVCHQRNVTSDGSEEPKDVNQYPPSNGFDFGDEEEWGDTSHNEDTNTTLTEADTVLRNASPLDGDGTKKSVITKTKVSSSNAMNGSHEEAAERATPPPTSKLVSRLFPNLRAESNKQQKPEQIFQQQQFEVTKQTVVSEGVQSKALRDKLMELETEIEKFRSENAALTKLRKEREEGLSKLHKEMEEFQKQKEAELKRLNDFKTEETRKLKKERKLFDQYQKAARAIPDKKEREEIENLKKQVTDLQDGMKRKEQRWTSSTTRLRDRIETLETENRELKEEIRLLEKKRLETWQQKEAEKKMAKAAVTSNPLLKKEDSRKNALAPTPQQQAPKLSDRDNALRLSSNMEELKAAMGGLSVKELDDSVLSTEAEDQEQSFESKTTSPVKSKEAKAIPRKKAPSFNTSNTVDRGDGEYEENTLPDGKVEKVYSNGSREILFPNGTRKQICSDGQSIIVSFFNGDVKQIMPDQRVVYYYSEAQTTHTTYPDGLEILQFPNNQVEKHYPDGTREISFPDHTIKYLFPSGVEESIFEDGTVIRVEKNGDKTMEFPNGQREVHTADYKRREYPDGTVKTVYPDGKQETRYSSGRIRIKDKEGNIIVDKRV